MAFSSFTKELLGRYRTYMKNIHKREISDHEAQLELIRLGFFVLDFTPHHHDSKSIERLQVELSEDLT